MFKHVQNLELQEGLAFECVVLKEFDNGDKVYIQLNELDRIDLDRLREIVTRRGAPTTALWDLMNQTTLRNGENALTYFDQMTMQLTASGDIIKPRMGQSGIGVKLKKKPGRPPKNSK